MKEQVLQLLKRFFYNRRIDWHKQNLEFFTKCERILDVGCGKGLFVGLDPERTIGVDSNRNSVHLCTKQGFHVVQGSALTLPFADRSFDGVYCADVIEHLLPYDARNLLVEATRVLKVGGILVVATPMPSSMFWNDPSHIRPYPPKDLLSYCVPEVNQGVGTQPTYESLPNSMRFVKLTYRRTQLYQLPVHLYFDADRTRLVNLLRLSSLLFILANAVSRIGLNHPRPEGYAIVMQKF